MCFDWSSAQRELFERIATFARTQLLNDGVVARDRACELSREAWQRCGSFGLLGLCLEQRYGGMQLDVLTTAGAVEAFGLGCEDMGLVFSACAHLFACAKPIELFADDPLKALVLPRLASGQWIGANAITEAEAGSDVFALRTTARRDGDGYVLNGAKSYVTNGPVADVFLVYASTDLEHGYLGVSAFVVERDTPGLQIGRALDKLGLSTSPVCSIYLEDCRVPGRNLVGREGIGGRIFEASMRWERGCLFASYLGLMQRQLDVSLRYARERRQGKRPIGGYQAISHRLVDMKLRLEAARMLLYRACWLADRDAAEAGQAIALAKLALSEAAVQSSLDAIQIHGAIGLARDAGVERALRDALPARIFSGTSEIQRNIAARNMGL